MERQAVGWTWPSAEVSTWPRLPEAGLAHADVPLLLQMESASPTGIWGRQPM